MNTESILQQCPACVTKEQIENLLQEHNNDIPSVLSECWKLSETPKSEKSEQKKKWENIRDICNTYEEEMNNFMKGNK